MVLADNEGLTDYKRLTGGCLLTNRQHRCVDIGLDAAGARGSLTVLEL